LQRRIGHHLTYRVAGGRVAWCIGVAGGCGAPLCCLPRRLRTGTDENTVLAASSD
jgi:hypothetical protein